MIFDKKIAAIHEAARLAEYHGLPFVVYSDKHHESFSVAVIDSIDFYNDNFEVVVLSNGTYQEVCSEVVKEAK